MDEVHQLLDRVYDGPNDSIVPSSFENLDSPMTMNPFESSSIWIHPKKLRSFCLVHPRNMLTQVVVKEPARKNARGYQE